MLHYTNPPTGQENLMLPAYIPTVILHLYYLEILVYFLLYFKLFNQCNNNFEHKWLNFSIFSPEKLEKY